MSIRIQREEIIDKVKVAVVKAGSSYTEDRYSCYKKVIKSERSELSRWAMETILDNIEAADERSLPLCDDTGIPHIILEVGEKRCISGAVLDAVYEGIREGLIALPGRPMSVKGDDIQRIEQSLGLEDASEAVVPAPLSLIYADQPDVLRLHILMQGGGPEIRAKTYRVFHKHSIQVVLDEVVSWAQEAVALLGCSPCTLAIGIGRSHYEASSLMLQAMVSGDYSVQSEYEKYITDQVNKTGVGALGLGGDTSVLATFMKIGAQRASGVRIVCMRPCCCFEPRRYSVDL